MRPPHLFQRNTCVYLVGHNCKVVLDALYRQILSQTLELVADPSVVALCAPLLLEVFECLLQYGQWADSLRVWCGCQAEIGLLELARRPDNRLCVPLDDVLEA